MRRWVGSLVLLGSLVLGHPGAFAADPVAEPDPKVTAPTEPLTVNVTGTLRLEQPTPPAPAPPPEPKLRAFTLFLPPGTTNHPIVWANDFQRDFRFSFLACYGHGEAATILPLFKGMADKSVVTAPCVCPKDAWAACTLNGPITLISFTDATTCPGASCVFSVKREGLQGEGAVSVRVQGVLQ